MECLEKFWCNFQMSWFLILPGLKDFYESSETDQAKYRKCWNDGQSQDAMRLILGGSTFSGHPTLTTLGNTMRSLSYIWWTLERVGIQEGWKKNKDSFSAASGDDSICWIRSAKTDEFVQALKETTAKDKKTPQIGLGQCIDGHKIFVNEFWCMDFCSKWCFYVDNEWYITRDYGKTLWNKQTYSGTNETLQARPALHCLAIESGLEAEGLKGSLLFALTELRTLKSGETIGSREEARKIWLQEHSWEIHYEHHQLPAAVLQQIDERLGLHYLDLGEIWKTGQIILPS